MQPASSPNASNTIPSVMSTTVERRRHGAIPRHLGFIGSWRILRGHGLAAWFGSMVWVWQHSLAAWFRAQEHGVGVWFGWGE